ncbi:acyltransferase family protein [Flexivirga alba]|uniref:Acyltransferase family protein n=1 Tax=Flexivirga alba TaxID=702742 RepID=A0ABW2AL54_9MICO
MSYRPALDGLRGVAVIAVLGYHLGIPWLHGGWLGVDVFFVLSGFLITSLLLHERHAWGRIDLPGFWLARARRLLPTLVLMLLSVSVVAAVWAPASRRSADAWDIFSAFFYVANWRLLLSDDQYFSSLSMPSPVVHTWSLAIEEQFYLIFPLLLIVLLALAARSRRRHWIVAGALAVLAALSVWRMGALYVPGADPSRVYYGTDTRAFELLIGAVVAVLMGGRAFGDRSRERDLLATGIDRVARWLAGPALLVLVIGFIVLDDASAIPFRGGLAVLCVLTVAPIVAGASRTGSVIQRLLAAEPLRRVGLISYALYVWHWPVIVFLNDGRLHLPAILRGLVELIVSVTLAYLTYRYVERPIRSGGLRALVPRRPRMGRPIAITVVAALTVALVALPRSGVGAAEAHGKGIQVTIPPYQPSSTKYSVSLIGNSIPSSLADAFPAGRFSDLTVSADVSFGCDPFEGQKVIGGQAQPVLSECPGFRKAWQNELRQSPPDVALFTVPQSITSDMKVNGKVLPFGSKSYLQWLSGMLSTMRSDSLAAGSKHFAIGTLSCHRMPGYTEDARHVDDDGRVATINAQVRRWASSTGTRVIDFHTLLCGKGYADTINDTPLYKDTLHYTSESGAVVWGWLAPQLQQIVRKG